MTTSVDRWLQTFMCQKYVDVFESWGYKTLQSVCRLEVEHLRAMGVLPEDCETIMEHVTILRQSLSAQCQSPPARFPDPMANPASSALMSMSRSASQRAMETVIPPPVEQFPPPNVPGYPQIPPGANYEEFHPRFNAPPDPSRYPYPQRPPGPWEQGQMGYPPQRQFMAPPPPHGKGWPRMPGAAGVMGPMYTARVSAPQGMGIYRGFRPPQDPQQVADDIVNMTSQRYSQPRQSSSVSGSSTPSSTKPSDPQNPTTSQPGSHFPSPNPVQVSSIGPQTAVQQPPNMRRYRLGSPQNSASSQRTQQPPPLPMSATGQPIMGPCMTASGPPVNIPGEVSPRAGFPPGPFCPEGPGASPLSPHSMTSPGSVYSGNSAMYNPGPNSQHPPFPGTSPLSGTGMMSPPMMRPMTPTSRPTPMMQQEFTPHIPSISEESEMMSRESPVLSASNSTSPNLSSCSFSASTSSTLSQMAAASVASTMAQSSAPSGYSTGKSSHTKQVGRKGDPLQSLHKLAMFTNSQVVDPKSVVHDACFSGAGGGAPMEEGINSDSVGQPKNCGSGSSVVGGMAELSQNPDSEFTGNRKLSHPSHVDMARQLHLPAEKLPVNSAEVDFTSRLMTSPKPEDDPPNADPARAGENEGCNLDGTDADVKMDLDLLLPDDLPAFSNSLEQSLEKKGGDLDLWGSDKIDEKWDLFDIPDLYTSNLIDNPEKEESHRAEESVKPESKDNDENKASSGKDQSKNIAQENPLISDLLSDSGDQESTRSRSCSPQKRAPKEKKKPTKTKAKKAKMKSDDEASGTDLPLHTGPPVMRPPPEYPYGGANRYIPTYGGYYHPQHSMGHQPVNHNQMHNNPQTCDPPAMYGYSNPQQQGYTQCLSTPIKADCNNVSDASPASTDMSPASSITATSPLSQQQSRSALEARKRRRVRNFVTPRSNVNKSETLSSPSPSGNPTDTHFPELNAKATVKDDKDLCLKARDSSNTLRRTRDLDCFPQRGSEKSCSKNGDMMREMGNNNSMNDMNKQEQRVGQTSRVENNNSISYSGASQSNSATLVSRVSDCERQPQNTPVERNPFLCLGGSNKEPPDKDSHQPGHRENKADNTHQGIHSISSNMNNHSLINSSHSSQHQFKRIVDQQKTAFRHVEKKHGSDSGNTNRMGNNESQTISGCSVITYPLVTCPSVHKSLHPVTVTKSLSRVSIPLCAVSSSQDVAEMATLSVVPDINGNLAVLNDSHDVICAEKQCHSKYLASNMKSECTFLDSEGLCLETSSRSYDAESGTRTVLLNKNLMKVCMCSHNQTLVLDDRQESLTVSQLLRLLNGMQSRLNSMDNTASMCKHTCSGVQDSNGNFCHANRNMVRLSTVVENFFKCAKSLGSTDNSPCRTGISVVEQKLRSVTVDQPVRKKCLCENLSGSDHVETMKFSCRKRNMFRKISRLTDWELNQINDCLSEFKSRKLNENYISLFGKRDLFIPGYFSVKDLYRDLSYINANMNITAMPVVETDNLPSVDQAAGNPEPEDPCIENIGSEKRKNDLTEQNSKSNGRVITSSLDIVPNSSNSISSSPTKSLKSTSPEDDGSPRRQGLRNRQLKAKQTENGFDNTEHGPQSNHSTPIKLGKDSLTVDTVGMGCEEDGSLFTITINDSSNSGLASESSRDAPMSENVGGKGENGREGTESPHFSMEKIQAMSKQVDIPIEIPLEIISIVKNDKMGSPTAVDIKTFNANLCKGDDTVFGTDFKPNTVKVEEIEQPCDVSNDYDLTRSSVKEEGQPVKKEAVESELTDSPKTKVKKKSQKRKRKSEVWEEDSNDEESFKKLNLSKTFGLFKSGKIKRPKLEKPAKGKSLKKDKKQKEKVKVEPEKMQNLGPIVRIKGPRDLPVDCQVINITDQDLDGKGRSTRENTNVPQVSYELNDSVPFVCSFCGHPSSFEGLGDLFGPYYPNEKKIGVGEGKKRKAAGAKSPTKGADVRNPKVDKHSKKNQEKSPERPKRNKKKSLDSMEWECETQKKASKKKSNSDTPKAVTNTPVTPAQKVKSTPKSGQKKGKASIETVVIDLTEDKPRKKAERTSATKSPKVISTKAKKSSGSTSKNITPPQRKKGQQSSSKKKNPGRQLQQIKNTPVKSDMKASAQKKTAANQKNVDSLLAGEEVMLEELWCHEDCLVWTSGVYIVGRHIHGIEEAVTHSRSTFCSRCKKVGATLGCFNKGCGQTFHFLCAKEASCYFDEESFSVYCSKHKTKKMKNPVAS